MARRIPSDRFEGLLRAATEVFIARGYRLTQMSDVAEAVGVAKGTLYGYVESKDALLALCLSRADEDAALALPDVLPLPSPPAGMIGAMVKEALARGIAQPVLEAAVAEVRADDPALEASRVVGELYDLMHANRHAIKLLDRCMDHPELSGLWQVAGREQTRGALLRYLELRTAAGQFRRFRSPRLAARLVIETCTTWAVHIHWDRSPEDFDPDEARANAIEFLVRGLVK